MTLFLIFLSLLLGLLVAQRHWYRQQLRRLNCDLDALLLRGTPLPIDQYREGELSILANQMEKITLRLSHGAQLVQTEKEHLADSLADISHQLRTPMTAMNLAITMLRSPDLERRRRMELTAELKAQLTRMDWLVESLLKLSKLEAGTVELVQETVPVSALLDRALSPLAIALELHEITVVRTCQSEQFTGDLSWTAEALGNLVKNALEHTPPGGQIFLSAEETPLFTRLVVEDTGPGFAPEDLPHLFERFYQGKQASDQSYGIGLALARSIITAQDGTIQAMNGKSGAKFVIQFYKQVV